METEHIKQQFEQILEDVIKINGLTIESATQIAAVILQETGKYRRTEMLREARLLGTERNSNNGNNEPATPRQKKALRNFGIKFSSNITKSEASRLIDRAIAEAGNGKGS